MACVLIVDDEADIRRLVEITLMRMGLDTLAAEDVAAARRAFLRQPIDVCLTDMQLPDGNGIELVRWINGQYPATPVAVITAYGSQDTAVEALKAGAFDFVSKPLDIKVLRKLVETALALDARAPVPSGPASRPAASAAQEVDHQASPLLGQADSIRALRRTIAKLARSQAPVYVQGESGTGKELVARMIHDQGPRAKRPFVPVNAGAIPAELMESEFFGHKKGSFTGATQDKAGLFAAAEGGTLFLDEVADLPLAMQVKLLRAIQERAVRPVGGDAEVPVDVRILSASHKDLAALVASGAFRQDLYYRLNVIEVQVPPLRDRSEDVPLLATHMLARISERHGLPAPPALTQTATQRLVAHAFPGNVRELENVLERAVTLCDNDRIDADDLRLQPAPAEADARPQGVMDSPAARPDTALPSVASPDTLQDELEDIERARIMAALTQTRFNKTKAAEKLGMSFRQLRYRIKKLRIDA